MRCWLGAIPTPPCSDGAAITDPKWLVSAPAHDLGVVLRGWNEELLFGSTAAVARESYKEVAALCGVDAEAI